MSMPMRWDGVLQSHDWKAMSYAQRLVYRTHWWDRIVAPSVPPNHRRAARRNFYARTSSDLHVRESLGMRALASQP